MTESAKSEELRALLRSAGLRSTTARVAVLELLDAASGPVSHADVAEVLVPRGVDRATVYRNLMDLTDAGLARRTDHGDHVWRFERLRAERKEHAVHPHFVCIDCGEVSCVSAGDVTIVLSGIPAGEVTEVLLRGRCVKCPN